MSRLGNIIFTLVRDNLCTDTHALNCFGVHRLFCVQLHFRNSFTPAEDSGIQMYNLFTAVHGYLFYFSTPLHPLFESLPFFLFPVSPSLFFPFFSLTRPPLDSIFHMPMSASVRNMSCIRLHALY